MEDTNNRRTAAEQITDPFFTETCTCGTPRREHGGWRGAGGISTGDPRRPTILCARFTWDGKSGPLATPAKT